MSETVKSFFHSLEEGNLTAKQFKVIAIIIAVISIGFGVVAAIKHINY